jgi:hypothetical protein
MNALSFFYSRSILGVGTVKKYLKNEYNLNAQLQKRNFGEPKESHFTYACQQNEHRRLT